jgi:hypothetical protein
MYFIYKVITIAHPLQLHWTQLEGGFVYIPQRSVVGRFPALPTECWRAKRENLNLRLTLVIVLPAAACATYEVCSDASNIKTLIMTSSFHLPAQT